MKTPIVILCLGALLLMKCGSPKSQKQTSKKEVVEESLPLDKIKLPEGFEISVYAKVNNARSLALGTNGTVFVGNRSGDKVYALEDKNRDGKAEKVYTLASGLNMPCGVAFREGTLYIAEVNRILRLPNIENRLEKPPKPIVVFNKFPSDRWHGWKFIAFGPDDKLYVPVGAPCNVCEQENHIYSSITRMNADGSGLEIFAHGVRNSVGFAWHPDTQELWFTDNGRDNLGDEVPPDELNRAYQKGLNFGFPYCHGGDIADPEFGQIAPCSDFVPPVQKLYPHTAALGMRFYTGTQFPQEYQKQIFIAEHGSWNRSKKIGYRISLVKLNGNQVLSYDTFAEGWLDEASQEAWGRPADILIMPDGALLISDDTANVVYRVVYKGVNKG